jgi:hypothetical protein
MFDTTQANEDLGAPSILPSPPPLSHANPRERRHPGAPTSPSALFPLHTHANEDLGVPSTLPSRLSNRHAPPLTDPSPPPAAKLPFTPADPRGKTTNGRTDHEAAVGTPKNQQGRPAPGRPKFAPKQSYEKHRRLPHRGQRSESTRCPNGEKEIAENTEKSVLLPKDPAFHPEEEGLRWRCKRYSA